jgi:putative nucleotidyltransferase with HDIG domain
MEAGLEGSGVLEGILPPEEGRRLLDEARALNPGPWYEHSLHAAAIARRIAEGLGAARPEALESAALLHDIGRRRGKTGLRHALDGWLYLTGLGALANARFCLTHTFPQDALVPWHLSDLTAEEEAFVRGRMAATAPALEDRIVELADMLASPFGPMVLEVRVMESALRNGRGGDAAAFLGRCLSVKRELELRLGGSVYGLFDRVRLEWPGT